MSEEQTNMEDSESAQVVLPLIKAMKRRNSSEIPTSSKTTKKAALYRGGNSASLRKSPGVGDAAGTSNSAAREAPAHTAVYNIQSTIYNNTTTNAAMILHQCDNNTAQVTKSNMNIGGSHVNRDRDSESVEVVLPSKAKKQRNSSETPTYSKEAASYWGERLKKVFEDEIIKAFPDITEFKKFAQSNNGLWLEKLVIQQIVEYPEVSEEEQKLQMLQKWAENQEEKPTVGMIRNVLREYLRNQSSEGHTVLRNEIFGMYKNRVLQADVFLGEVIGSYFCAIKLQLKNENNLREAKILSTLRHHVNVVSIQYAGIYCSDPLDYVFIAMDLSWTDTVRNMLEDINRLAIPFDEFISMNLVKQILRALDFIHSNNIIHRDFKPENVLLSRDWSQSKVANFGFSKTVTDGQSTRQTGQNVGTDGYRARETYFPKAKISTKSDIHSAGVTIAEISSNGKHPFGDDPYLWSRNILDNENNKNVNLSQLCVTNNLDQLENLIKRMLKMDQNGRPTAEEALNEVEQYQTSSQPKNQQNTADQCSATSSKTQPQRPTAVEVSNEVQECQALSQPEHQESTADQSSAASSMTPLQRLTAEEVPNEIQQFHTLSQPKNQQSTADQSSAASSMTQLQCPTAEEVPQFQALSPHIENQQTTSDQSSASAPMAELSIKEKANTIIMFDWSDKLKRIYSFKAKKWSPMQECKIGSFFQPPVVAGRYIYILQSQVAYRLEYSDLTAKWKKIASMNENYGECPSVAELNGVIYVCGASGLIDPSRSVERYDADLDQWTLIPHMKLAKACSSVYATKGSIYVCGGSGSSDDSKSVQQYDLVSKEWKLISNMINESTYSCVFATKDHIYCIGGRDRLEHLSVKRFDEKSKKWEVVESLPRSINKASVAVVNNQIYVADHEGVLCYDTQKNSWSKMQMEEWSFVEGWLVKIYAVDEELYVIGRIPESSFNTAIYLLEPRNGQMTLIEKFYSDGMNLHIFRNWSI